MKTKQQDFWAGDFGKEYTDRNSYSREDYDTVYKETWGFTKHVINEKSIGHLNRDIKILEVGCNTGMQLRALQDMGFKNLYGIELQKYAVQTAKKYLTDVNIIQGSGFDIPFKDGYFDLVCTNGVLIHISPNDHHKIMGEMNRCSKKYIGGFEYFSENIQEISYRGNNDYLWKANFAEIFRSNHSELSIVSTQDYPYVNEENKGNTDRMYLLEK